MRFFNNSKYLEILIFILLLGLPFSAGFVTSDFLHRYRCDGQMFPVMKQNQVVKGVTPTSDLVFIIKTVCHKIK